VPVRLDEEQRGPAGRAQCDYTVDWRFASLRMINADVGYDSRFPAGYDAGHS
jgi:hypothetical protein